MATTGRKMALTCRHRRPYHLEPSFNLRPTRVRRKLVRVPNRLTEPLLSRQPQDRVLEEQGELVSYRNKTYVAFASEDIHCYRMMEAWRDNDNIDFSFFDAHDLYVARDTSTRETIKRRLRERLSNTAKQVVLLGSRTAKRKGGDGWSFLAHEVDTIIQLNLPVVVANLDGTRDANTSFIPKPFLDAQYYTVSVSFQAAVIKYALDEYAPDFVNSEKSGNYHYKPHLYTRLGL